MRNYRVEIVQPYVTVCDLSFSKNITEDEVKEIVVHGVGENMLGKLLVQVKRMVERRIGRWQHL